MAKRDSIENVRIEDMKDETFDMYDSCFDCLNTPEKCDNSMSKSTNSIDLDLSNELSLSIVSSSSHGRVESVSSSNDDCLQTKCHVEKMSGDDSLSAYAKETDPEKIKDAIRRKPPDQVTRQDLIDYMNNMFV